LANGEQYRDLSPKQIVPRLADEGLYVASESTFYRVLREHGQLQHRGKARASTKRQRVEHVASAPTWPELRLRPPGPLPCPRRTRS
jgi:putative transposase